MPIATYISNALAFSNTGCKVVNWAGLLEGKYIALVYNVPETTWCTSSWQPLWYDIYTPSVYLTDIFWHREKETGSSQGQMETDLDMLVWLVRPEEVWAASQRLTGVVRDEHKTLAGRRREEKGREECRSRELNINLVEVRVKQGFLPRCADSDQCEQCEYRPQ